MMIFYESLVKNLKKELSILFKEYLDVKDETCCVSLEPKLFNHRFYGE